MHIYEVIYFRGRDHDDWNKMEVMASDDFEAKQKAIDLVPPGHNVKRIKMVQRLEHDMFGMMDTLKDTTIKTSANKRTTPNTMEQIKIQSVTPQGTFDHNGKTFHKFDVILDNGMVGEVNALTPDKWKEGDEVVVKEHQQTKWGPRLKLDKPGFNGGGSPSPKGPANNDVKGIVASWAVACAMQAAGDPFQKDYDSIVLQLARVALSARKVIKDEVEV
jgi:hypothetical protein